MGTRKRIKESDMSLERAESFLFKSGPSTKEKGEKNDASGDLRRRDITRDAKHQRAKRKGDVEMQRVGSVGTGKGQTKEFFPPLPLLKWDLAMRWGQKG